MIKWNHEQDQCNQAPLPYGHLDFRTLHRDHSERFASVKKETHFLATIGLQSALDSVQSAINSLATVGIRSTALYIRNAQIELTKAAEELTLAASREVPCIYTTPRAPIDWHEDYGNALWWDANDGAPPYSGNPLDDDFPFDMSYPGLWWTPLPPVDLSSP